MYKTVKYNIHNTQKICKLILYMYTVQYIYYSLANYSNIFNLTMLFYVLNHVLFYVKYNFQYNFIF